MIRHFSLWIVIFLTVIGLKSISAAASFSSTEKLIDAWVQCWNNYDLERVKELFLDDDRLTYFSSEKEGGIRGMEAVLEHHRGFGFVSGGKKQPNKLWLENRTVDEFGPVSVVTAVWFFQREDGRVQKGPVTFVILDENGDQRIIHVHFANYPSGSDGYEQESLELKRESVSDADEQAKASQVDFLIYGADFEGNELHHT